MFVMSCGINSESPPNSLAQDGESHVNYDSLKARLEKMYTLDQEIRRVIIDSIGIDSPGVGKYFAEMHEIDSINQQHLKEILANHGWLPQSKVGEKASDAIFYVIQHSDIELMQKYFPQLKELAAMNEAKLTHAAMMEDRLLMRHGKKQKYGTQASGTLREDEKFAIWPIENPDSVNLLRKNAGFELSVEENAQRMNAVYDKNERLPESIE